MTSMTQLAANEHFTNQMHKFDKVKNTEGLNTTWSIYEVSDVYAKAAIKTVGKKVVYETVDLNASDEEVAADILDGGHRSSAVFSSFVGGDTWLDLWKAAESVIKQSGTHHSFIEDFTMNEYGTIELTTGS